ncbi:LytR/AlgR family response regulator transcription factor [Flagellimonas meridianipacifica]|uniref:DNA-binding LytR/AlgR family response regulator n=1 Tax=Flagellimonas meridianipacifica TaxID=1080225 RepID=A0A2T0MA28_9FLAO|nr:response regulator transcription factor [Allomuricauda pacifica]PRX54387.1 DNA-binding LytR/AlgR family response regulator [Allomuricauda pacifica]
MIRCILVDDEPLARSLLEGHIAEIPYLELLGSFKNALEASDFLNQKKVDVVFLDIQMPKLTGLDFLSTLSNPPKVIFTTAYREYALDSYEFEAVDYLLKPITFSRFLKAVNKLVRGTQNVLHAETENPNPDYMFVSSNKKQVKVVFDSISHIESLKDYIRIHLPNESLVIKEQLGNILKDLPSHFIRVHRSYVINSQKVTAYTARDIEVASLEIPIGGKYKEYVFSYLKNNLNQ